MDKAIKTLGLFPIRINLHSEVAVTVTVNIARSLEEAETQAKLGHAIIASDNDFDDAPEAEAPAEAQAHASEEVPAEDVSPAKQKLKSQQVMQMLRLMTLPLKTQQKKHLRIQKRPSLFSAPQILESRLIKGGFLYIRFRLARLRIRAEIPNPHGGQSDEY